MSDLDAAAERATIADETGRLRRDVAKLQRAIAHAETVRKQAEQDRDAAESALKLVTALPAIDVMPRQTTPTPAGKGDRATAMLLCSDWHVEQVIDPAKVQGLNAFDEKIARQRVERLIDKSLMLLEKQRRVAKIDELLIWLGGDFISGNIHDELLEGNSLPLVDAVSFAEELIAMLLSTMAKSGGAKRLRVVCNYGNHGRVTKKPRIATGAANNVESLMYRHMAKQIGLRLHRVPIEWHIPAGEHAVVDVRGMLVRFQHGDAIKYAGGVGGITIPVNKAIASWNHGQRVGLDVFGHWHQFLHGRRFIANGCLVGYDEFALRIKAEYGPATQTLVVVDEKYGVTSCEQVFLADPVSGSGA